MHILKSKLPRPDYDVIMGKIYRAASVERAQPSLSQFLCFSRLIFGTKLKILNAVEFEKNAYIMARFLASFSKTFLKIIFLGDMYNLM